jgi:uncharacterized membrane protein (Fun14 family)
MGIPYKKIIKILFIIIHVFYLILLLFIYSPIILMINTEKYRLMIRVIYDKP